MIDNKLCDVFKEVLQIDIAITDGKMKFKDMEVWDSMTFMMLIVKIEEAFNISLTAQEIIEIDCLDKAKEIIDKNINN